MVCNVFRIVDFGSFWGKPNYEVAFALVNTTRNFVFVQPYPTLHSVLSLVTVRFLMKIICSHCYNMVCFLGRADMQIMVYATLHISIKYLCKLKLFVNSG